MSKELKIEETIGDDRCAFNAFALAFSNEQLLNQWEEYLKKQKKDPNSLIKDFIDRVAVIFQVEANWLAVKAELLKRRSNKEELQRLLAPILRGLAVEQAKKDNFHIERTYIPLPAAFQEFVYNECHIKFSGKKDDIYQSHSRIQQKFLEFYEKCFKTNQPLDQQQIDHQIKDIQNDLQQWWKEEGYAIFLDEMARNSQWAGDLELYQLGVYFNIAIKVLQPDFEHGIYDGDASMPKIVLTNPDGKHWSNVLPEIDKAVLKSMTNEKTDEEKVKQFRAATEDWISLHQSSTATLKKWEDLIHECEEKSKKKSGSENENSADSKDVASTASLPLITYNVGKNKTIKVSKEDQIALDRALAEKLQLEEYDINKKDPIELDRTLAEKLQLEEYNTQFRR